MPDSMPNSASVELQPAIERILVEPRFHLGLVTLLAILLFFSKLGAGDLRNYDDAYYAQKAKEIWQTNDWITMHYDRQPRFDNPPLFMWLAAVSYQMFGVNEYAARFPSALLGVATVVLVYFFARRWYGPWIGFYSAFALSTTLLFARYARRSMVDVTLTFFVCLALFALVLALEKNRRYFLLWGVSISLGILTKSVLGLFPLFITLLYLLLTRRFRLLRDRYFLLGTGIILVLGGSWYLHQYLHFGKIFLTVHFRWLIWERGFLLEPQSWYAHLSYLKELAMNHWPWLPLLVLGLAQFSRKARQGNSQAVLLLLWVLTPLLVLSTVQSRSPWYVLQIFPGAAIVSGTALATLLKQHRRLAFAKTVSVIAVVSLIGFNASPFEVGRPRSLDVRILAPYVKHYADKGARVVAFRLVPWELNNALLFYSDYAAQPSHQSYRELAEALADEHVTLCVVASSELDAVTRNVPNVHLLRKAEKLALVANQPLDTAGVRPW